MKSGLRNYLDWDGNEKEEYSEMKKYVLVTGATGGIGSAVIRQALSEPAVHGVWGVCRNQAKWDRMFEREKNSCHNRLQCISAQPERMGEDLRAMLCAQETGQEEAVEMILVLTAFSIQPAERILSLDSKALQENLYANLEEPIRQLQTILVCCRQQGISCKVVYLGSGAAHKPLQGWSLYGAGKSFMNLFLQTLVLEEGIPVVCFDPGVVDTSMQEQIRSMPQQVFDQVQTFRDYHTQHKLHTPQEVADHLVRRYILDWQAAGFEEKYRRA